MICVKAKLQYVQYDFNDLDQFQPTFYKRQALSGFNSDRYCLRTLFVKAIWRDFSLDDIIADPENAVEACFSAENKRACLQAVLNPYSWIQSWTEKIIDYEK